MPVKHLINRGIGFSPGSVKYIVTLGLSIGAGGGPSGLVKKILLGWHKSGATFYAVIRREADSYLMNDADGAFASTPADPYLALAENGIMKGLYEVSESRSIWNDGHYVTAVYKQTGATPNMTVDSLMLLKKIKLTADAVIEEWSYMPSATILEKYIRNKKLIVTEAGVKSLVIYDDNGTTEIVRKTLKDQSGNDISDLAAGILAIENSSSV